MLALKLHPASTNYVIIAILYTDRGKNRKRGTGRARVLVILLTCASTCPPMSLDKDTDSLAIKEDLLIKFFKCT